MRILDSGNVGIGNTNPVFKLSVSGTTNLGGDVAVSGNGGVLVQGGTRANPASVTANPFASVTTVTTQIVQLLTGDQEFDSAKTLAAFALGLVLFLITLLLNLIALRIVRKYQEQYE